MHKWNNKWCTKNENKKNKKEGKTLPYWRILYMETLTFMFGPPENETNVIPTELWPFVSDYMLKQMEIFLFYIIFSTRI